MWHRPCSTVLRAGERPGGKMEIKRTSESMVNSYQQDSNNLKQVKSEPTISRGISSTADSFQDAGSDTSRNESANNLRQRTDISIGNSEFDGREATKQLQEKLNNPILLPGTPIKTYTLKESDTPVLNREKSKLEEYFDGLKQEPGKLQPRERIGDEE
jgi:hypothetical protein